MLEPSGEYLQKSYSPVVKWHFLLKRVSRYGRCFMIDSGSKGCPEQESAGCHFGTLGRNFLRAKTKWPPNITRSNMIFQQMKPATSVIPHFHVILTGQSISCIILMTQKYIYVNSISSDSLNNFKTEIRSANLNEKISADLT